MSESWQEMLLESCAAAVESAGELDGALAALGGALAVHYPVNRVSLRGLVPSGDQLEVVGLWTDRPTRLERGTRMSLLATAYGEVARTGRPAIRSTASYLLDDILRHEGIASWVSMPVTDGASLVALLSLSSRSVDAFRADHAPFFEALAARLEKLILERLPHSGSL